MGRPLKAETIEAMNLTVTTKTGTATLGKQVGFNKYVTSDSTEDNLVVVRLAEDIVEDNDAVLALSNGEVVTKILRNIVQTSNGIYAYELTDKGVVFEDSSISFVTPDAGVSTMSLEEETTTTVTKTKSSSKKTTTVVEEETKVEETVSEETTAEEVAE